MNRTPLSCLLLGMGCLHALPLFAGEASPTDPDSPAPAASYHSVFQGYRAFQEEPIKDWRGLNDEVARIGGHIGIFRGAGGHAGHGARTPVSPGDQAQGTLPARDTPRTSTQP